MVGRVAASDPAVAVVAAVALAVAAAEDTVDDTVDGTVDGADAPARVAKVAIFSAALLAAIR